MLVLGRFLLWLPKPKWLIPTEGNLQPAPLIYREIGLFGAISLSLSFSVHVFSFLYFPFFQFLLCSVSLFFFFVAFYNNFFRLLIFLSSYIHIHMLICISFFLLFLSRSLTVLCPFICIYIVFFFYTFMLKFLRIVIVKRWPRAKIDFQWTVFPSSCFLMGIVHNFWHFDEIFNFNLHEFFKTSQ